MNIWITVNPNDKTHYILEWNIYPITFWSGTFKPINFGVELEEGADPDYFFFNIGRKGIG